MFLGFPGGSAGKESSCSVGDLGSVPGLGRSSGEGKGHPLQYSGLENSMDCIVHGVAKRRTRVVLKGLPAPEGGVLSPCSGVAARAAVGVLNRASSPPAWVHILGCGFPFAFAVYLTWKESR